MTDVKLLVSGDFSSNTELRSTKLYMLFFRIRRCQMLCKESQQTTFVGSLSEFIHAHNILDRVTLEEPVEKQKLLLIELRKEETRYDDELFKRISALVDHESGWDRLCG